MPTPHQITPTADAAQLPPFVTEAPKRTRRRFKRVPVEGDPTVCPVSPGIVSVSLFGGRAAGRSMLIDVDVWEDISERLTSQWMLNSDGKGREYVRSGANAIARSARQPGDRPTASLARIVAGARRGQVVSYLDLDRKNLTRRNLLVDGKPVLGSAARA